MYFFSPSTNVIPASPKQLTADDELNFGPQEGESDVFEEAAPRSQTYSSQQTPRAPPPAHTSLPGPRSLEYHAKRQMDKGGSEKPQEESADGLLVKDTLNQETPKEEPNPEEWGTRFRIQWIKVGRLPFTHTRHLRNPWNADREVKVSRDGTEVEPSEFCRRARVE